MYVCVCACVACERLWYVCMSFCVRAYMHMSMYVRASGCMCVFVCVHAFMFE